MKSWALLWCAAVVLVSGCRVGGDDSVGVGEERPLVEVSRPGEWSAVEACESGCGS